MVMQPQQGAPVMDEDAQAPAGAPPDGGQQMTADVPMSVFGGQAPKEGDMCQFKVVAVNGDSGSVTLAYMPAGGPSAAGGTDGMADEFSKDKMTAKGAM